MSSNNLFVSLYCVPMQAFRRLVRSYTKCPHTDIVRWIEEEEVKRLTAARAAPLHFHVGDVVSVVHESPLNKGKVHTFQGLVIASTPAPLHSNLHLSTKGSMIPHDPERGGLLAANFTVRNILGGNALEQTFPLHGPFVKVPCTRCIP